MPTKCAVLNCKNSTKIAGDVSFHRFPSDSNVIDKWIEATGNKNWFPTIHSRICSVHFTDDNFTETNKLRRLTKEAIPTVDVLKTSISDENKDQQLTAKKPSACNTPKKIKLEKDIRQPSNENTLFNTHKERILAHKLNHAQHIIKQKNKHIKTLREQNRRKGLKILTLVALIGCLKKKSFISDG